MQIKRTIAIALLAVIILFATSIFITTSNLQTTNHDGCFGQDCGPIQHLIHNYPLADYPTTNNKTQSYLILITNNKPISINLTPDTPPPRI